MLPLQFQRRWVIANGTWLIAVLILTLTPPFMAFADLGPVIPHKDKILHAIVFFLLAIWFTGQYAKDSYWNIALCLLAFGAVIEVGQAMIPYRTAEWADLAADGLGVLIGIGVALIATGGWGPRAESWLNEKFG